MRPLGGRRKLSHGQKKMKKGFRDFKLALISAPALALPDVTKPFHLFVADNKGIAKGVLTQRLGSWERPVAYLSKKKN